MRLRSSSRTRIGSADTGPSVSSSCSVRPASANCVATSSRASAARSTRSVCSAACPIGQPLAFQQVGDQVAHLRQIAQQRVAVLALGHQLGIHARARERAAQLVADRQQQRALRIEHALQAARHLVDALGQLAELVAPCGGDRLPEIARAETRDAGADRIERLQQLADVEVREQRQRQQRGQRDQADALWPLARQRARQAEADAVTVCGRAHQAPAFGRPSRARDRLCQCQYP